MEMLPLLSIAPVRWQALLYPLRTLRSSDENTVSSATDEVPAAGPPFVSLLNEKVRGKAQFDKRVGWTVLVFQFIGGYAFGYDRSISPVTLILLIHKAILAARTGFLASVPGIPRHRMLYLCILHD